MEANGQGQEHELARMEAQATPIGGLPPGSVDLSHLVKLIRALVPELREPREVARQFAIGLVQKITPQLTSLEWQKKPLLIVQWTAAALLELKAVVQVATAETTSSPTPEASLPPALKLSSDET